MSQTVTIYTKPNCVQCDATKRAFERKGIKPEMVDVSTNNQAYVLVVGMGYRQVPVVVAGDDHWSGFRPDKIGDL